MPITRWTCPTCRQVVSLDHFAHSDCGVHPDYAAAVLADRKAQNERTGVRVSNGLSCPRKAAILAQEDVAVDPLGMLSPLKGTAWHALMESAAGSVHPAGLGTEIEVAGELGGIPVTGKIDRVRIVAGRLVGEDWKTGSDFRIKFIKPSAKSPTACAPLEYRVQLSLYAELYRQQFGRAWDGATIWWAFSNDMWPESIEILDVETCLAHHPYECDYSVAQLLEQAAAGKHWTELPLVGESIKFGTKDGCSYCEVRDVCWTQAKLAPF